MEAPSLVSSFAGRCVVEDIGRCHCVVGCCCDRGRIQEGHCRDCRSNRRGSVAMVLSIEL